MLPSPNPFTARTNSKSEQRVGNDNNNSIETFVSDIKD